MQMKFLLAHAAPYRTQLILISLLTIAASLAILAVPWLAGELIGGVLDDRPQLISRSVWLLVVALIATTGLGVASSVLSAWTSARILADLRRDAYAHIQQMPMVFHDRRRQGDLIALMTYEVDNLSAFITSTLANLPSMLLTAAGAMVLLFLIDPVLALFIPVLLPVFFVVMKVIGRRMRVLAGQARQAEAMLVTLAQEHLEMIPAIKSFAVEEEQKKVYDKIVEESRVLRLAQVRLTAILGPVVGLVAALAAIGILVVAGGQLDAEGKSPSELFSFLLYAALLTRPVGALADVYGQYQWARGTLARLQDALERPIEPGFAQTGTIERAKGEVAFSGVSFSYPGRDPVLRDVDLHVQAGEIVALTGENGAGKSTLINLLLRFYDPAQGLITLDDQDISQLQVQNLRRQIGYVPQRALLFDGSVRDNITFGHKQASEAEIEAATRLSQAYDFIASLPRGLDTRIGDHGVRLSGGQRQRIALARALINSPPVLIFDEATSMYDLEGEAAFVEACQSALAGRTVIIVTHRPASLALADRIVSVQDGRVREIADPASL